MLLLHSINNSVAYALALGFNGLLIFLVFSNRSQELQIYNRILAMTCIVDLVFSSVTFIGEPIYSQMGEYSMLLNNGFVSRYLDTTFLSRYLDIPFFFCMAFDFLLYYSLSMNAVQFGYRYILLKWGPDSLTTPRLLIMCILAMFGPAGLIFLILLQHVDKADFDVYDPDGSLRADIARAMNDEKPYVCAAARLSFHWTLSLLYIMLMCVVVYTIIVVCGYQIYMFPKKRYGDLAKRQRSVDQQIFRTLIIQAILPMVLISLAMIVLFMAYFSGSSPIEITSLLMEPLAWLPAINPLITITTVSVYRRRIMSAFSRKSVTTTTISTISSSDRTN